MPPKKNKDGRVWLYHEDCPEGKIFDKPDLDEMGEAGWVRTPADLDLPEVEEEVEELTEEKVKGFRPEDMVAHVKGMGFAVLTPDELESEKVKYADSLPMPPLDWYKDDDILASANVRSLIKPEATPLVIDDFSDDDLLAEVAKRGLVKPGSTESPVPENGLSLSDRFNEYPKSLTKEEHILLGKNLGVTLRKTWSEAVMIEKITAKLNEAG